MVKPEKWLQLQLRMQSLNISEEDLREKFVIGSGKGGQNLHKTASCVDLLHIPTGIVTKCQQERSRETNRYYARKRLCDKIEMLQLREKNERSKEIEKIRRQKRKRSKRAKEKILDRKHQRSQLKSSRKKPGIE